MSWFDEFASAVGAIGHAIAASPVVAAVMGAVLSLKWAPGDSFKERAFSFGCGVAVAIYGVPWLIEYLSITSKVAPLAFAFLGGLLGMNIIAKVVDTCKNADWGAALESVQKALSALRGGQKP